MKKLILSLFLLVFVGFGAGLAAEREEYKAAVDKDGIQRVEVVGGSYYFKPNYIILKVNVPAELKVRKESGITPHNLVINSPEAKMKIRINLSTDPQVVTFTPNKIGKFPFYCDKKFLFFESHRDKGMEGTIEVRE